MLKTALALAYLGATSVAALAFETPKYDRKIERAAIMQVGKKLGALRTTVDAELPVNVADVSVETELDLEETAAVAALGRQVQGPAAPKRFWIVAGIYQ